jgi:hypothetical protein
MTEKVKGAEISGRDGCIRNRIYSGNAYSVKLNFLRSSGIVNSKIAGNL